MSKKIKDQIYTQTPAHLTKNLSFHVSKTVDLCVWGDVRHITFDVEFGNNVKFPVIQGLYRTLYNVK